MSVILRSAQGAFAAAVNYGAGENPYRLDAGDLTGDGRPDLAVAKLPAADHHRSP